MLFRWKKVLLLTVSIIFLLSGAWLCLQAGVFREVPDGTILVGGDSAIYALSPTKGFFLTKKMADLEVFFSDTRYDNYNSPIQRSDGLICSARNIENNQYVVLQIARHEIKELIKSDKLILHPLLTNNDEDLTYIGLDKQNDAYLYKYNLKKQVTTKIYRGTVAPNRPLISNDGTILFVNEHNRKAGDIMQIDSKGNISIVVRQANSPLWVEEGRILIYFDYVNKSVMMYDLTTGQKSTIVKTHDYLYDFALSPDKRHIAYFENVPIGVDTTLGIYFRLSPLDGAFKRSLGNTYHYMGPGMSWTNRRDAI